jgi:hypothetical protein
MATTGCRGRARAARRPSGRSHPASSTASAFSPTPPTGPTLPSTSMVPGGGDVLAAGVVGPVQQVGDDQGVDQPGRRSAHPLPLDELHLERQIDLQVTGLGSDAEADAPRHIGQLRALHLDLHGLAAPLDGEVEAGAGRVRPDDPLELLEGLDSLAVDGDDHVVRAQSSAAGTPSATWVTRTPLPLIVTGRPTRARPPPPRPGGCPGTPGAARPRTPLPRHPWAAGPTRR